MGDKCTTFTSHLSPSFPQHITTAQHGRKKDLIIIQKTSSSVQSTQTRYWKRCGPNGKTKKDVVFFFWNVWVCAAKWQTCSVEQLPIAASLCGIGHLNETTFFRNRLTKRNRTFTAMLYRRLTRIGNVPQYPKGLKAKWSKSSSAST